MSFSVLNCRKLGPIVRQALESGAATMADVAHLEHLLDNLPVDYEVFDRARRKLGIVPISKPFRQDRLRKWVALSDAKRKAVPNFVPPRKRVEPLTIRIEETIYFKQPERTKRSRRGLAAATPPKRKRVLPPQPLLVSARDDGKIVIEQADPAGSSIAISTDQVAALIASLAPFAKGRTPS